MWPWRHYNYASSVRTTDNGSKFGAVTHSSPAIRIDRTQIIPNGFASSRVPYDSRDNARHLIFRAVSDPLYFALDNKKRERSVPIHRAF